MARLFFLDLGGGRVMSCNPDGSDLKTIVTEARKLPDGVVVDEKPATFTGQIWAALARMMAPSFERISMAKT